MPAPRVKALGDVASKWVRRASAAGEDYRSGVTGAGGRWAAGAKAASQVWRQAVTEAAGQDRYGRGVDKAGPARYERGAVEKGPARYSQGVTVAEGDYSQRFGPFLQAIASVDLPPRGPRGAAGNFQRVQAIGTALNKLRMAR